MCEYCDCGKPLVIGKTNDQGIAIQFPDRLIAYGYDIHGSGSNGLVATIKHCPMCGRKLANRIKNNSSMSNSEAAEIIKSMLNHMPMARCDNKSTIKLMYIEALGKAIEALEKGR